MIERSETVETEAVFSLYCHETHESHTLIHEILQKVKEKWYPPFAYTSGATHSPILLDVGQLVVSVDVATHT